MDYRERRYTEKQLLRAYHCVVRGGVSSRAEVLSRDLLAIHGLGPLGARLITEAARTYSDEEWATTFPRLAGILPKSRRRELVATSHTGPERQDKTLSRERLPTGLLTSRERRVLDLRYGLAGDRRLTLHEIGQVWGLTRSRIDQIFQQGRAKLFSLEMLHKRGVSLAEGALEDLAKYRFILYEPVRSPTKGKEKKSVQAQCQVCGEPLSSPKRRKYCSYRCGRKAVEKRRRRTRAVQDARRREQPLTEREKHLLDKYHGINGAQKHSLKQLSEEMDLRPLYICQVASRALQKVGYLAQLQAQGQEMGNTNPLTGQQREDLDRYGALVTHKRSPSPSSSPGRPGSCVECGTPFITTSSNPRQYCSKSCWNVAYWRRRKVRLRASKQAGAPKA